MSKEQLSSHALELQQAVDKQDTMMQLYKQRGEDHMQGCIRRVILARSEQTNANKAIDRIQATLEQLKKKQEDVKRKIKSKKEEHEKKMKALRDEKETLLERHSLELTRATEALKEIEKARYGYDDLLGDPSSDEALGLGLDNDDDTARLDQISDNDDMSNFIVNDDSP